MIDDRSPEDIEAGITRNEDGTIKTKVLSKDKAAEMARLRWAKPIKDDTEALIREAGFDVVEDAPTHFKLNCKKAAQGDIRAIVEYRKFTRLAEVTTKLEAVETGTRCPTCNQYQMIGLKLTPGQLETIWESIQEESRLLDLQKTPEGIEVEIARLTELLTEYQVEPEVAKNPYKRDWYPQGDVQ